MNLKSRNTRADYVNDEEISEIISWKHPYVYADSSDIEFTEGEKIAIINLPRKECRYSI